MLNDQNLPAEQLRFFYETEKSLAARLRNADKSERQSLYQLVYEELYRLVPFHPMLTRKRTPAVTQAVVAGRMAYLRRFLRPDMSILDIGAGDCHLSFELARHARKVYAVEVSREIAATYATPANFELVITTGTDIAVPAGSIDLACSNQLMEHLHPEDALEQLRNVVLALKPGGLYVCSTPHRLHGPSDVSQYFDEVATGFHLKEYTYAELSAAFREAGFSRSVAFVKKGPYYFRVPMSVMIRFERIATRLFGHRHLVERQRWLSRRPFNVLLQGIQIVGQK